VRHMAIRLDRIGSIPGGFLVKLNRLRNIFVESEYLDEILNDSATFEIAQELHRYVEENGVLGFHYTRAFPERIRDAGLIAIAGGVRRTQFLGEFGDLFSSEQRARIENCWCRYFNVDENERRDFRVYFAGSNDLSKAGVVQPLYKYYGGEVVNMALNNEKDIMALIAKIGVPLVIGCSLNARDLREPYNYDFGRALISAYHASVNCEAEWVGFSTYSRVSILPSQITGIWELVGNGALMCT